MSELKEKLKYDLNLKSFEALLSKHHVARLAQSVERETFKRSLKNKEISRPRVRAPYRAIFF
jgi:hypothetical protein